MLSGGFLQNVDTLDLQVCLSALIISPPHLRCQGSLQWITARRCCLCQKEHNQLVFLLFHQWSECEVSQSLSSNLPLCLVRFSWRRNGRFFNIGKDPRVTMRKRSGTLEIGFRSGGRPEDYEGEYQCFATNEFGVALSNKILLRVSSKNTEDIQCFTSAYNIAIFLKNIHLIFKSAAESYWMTQCCMCVLLVCLFAM